MTHRIHNYTGEKIDVTYDAERCIHAAECIRRLHTVFDSSKRPWVQPDAGSADGVAATILHCPSGALHYTRKDSGAEEPTPDHNTIHIAEDGPLYLRGNFTIINSSGETVVQDTRAALCRCGASANKPFCDNSHITIKFEAPDSLNQPQSVSQPLESGHLHIEPTRNGPLHLTGHFALVNEAGDVLYQGTDEWLCRCGGSHNKPFCDSTHKQIGFEAD